MQDLNWGFVGETELIYSEPGNTGDGRLSFAKKKMNSDWRILRKIAELNKWLCPTKLLYKDAESNGGFRGAIKRTETQ